jgi:hypothetical protein
MLPIILQHVREQADVHIAPPERARYKVITPFPPAGQDFPEFQDEDLAFRDLPADAPSASLDTLHAYEFFKRTDGLYYDYSYGIKSEEFLLSRICERFFDSAQKGGNDLAFNAPFDEMKDAFTNRFARVTSGDLGHLPFKYTSLSPISWTPDRIVLNTAEVERLKQKALAVYADLEPGSVGFLNALIDEVKASNYSSVQYELGFFDVIREWMDPRLFESSEWAFPWGGRTLFGEGDPVFADNTVKLCYAQRFYVIRNYSGTAAPTPQPEPPQVRDHGADRVIDGSPIDLRRRMLRNVLIHRKLDATVLAPSPVGVAIEAPPPPRAGFVWIAATAAVPGHWERARAGAPVVAAVADPPPAKPGYKIAALKCRLLSATP